MNSRVRTTQTLSNAINKSVNKPQVFVLITGVGAYEPSDHKKYDESSPTTGNDFFSKLLVEWEKAAQVSPPTRLVSILTKTMTLIEISTYVQKVVVLF